MWGEGATNNPIIQEDRELITSQNQKSSKENNSRPTMTPCILPNASSVTYWAIQTLPKQEK